MMLAALAGFAIGAPSMHAAVLPKPSSHRKAPSITGMPKVDATDFYMFNSYEAGREGFVIIVANYQPFQTPYGGPNFFQKDPEALYQINIDSDADAKTDYIFTFNFGAYLRDPAVPVGGVNQSVPLYNIGTLGPGQVNINPLNTLETSTLSVTRPTGRGDGRKKLPQRSPPGS